ncbi:MAG TPA: hypothetical protein VF545_06695 [Thermoleophilaceae bacterium]|jgi:hypothetical protein
MAAILFGGLVALAVAGCGGGEDFKDNPRPPVPIQLTGVIKEKAVSVEPSHLGAGPVVLLIQNQTKQSHTVIVEGGPHNRVEQVGPINPLDAGRIQETLEPGDYTIRAGSDRAAARKIEPARLKVGPARDSSSGEVLLP